MVSSSCVNNWQMQGLHSIAYELSKAVISYMIIRKTTEQIEGIAAAAQIVAKAIREMAQAVEPGMTTAQLEKVAIGVFEKNNAQSAFFAYRPVRGVPAYPGYICVSVNDEVVHGIADDRKILSTDIVSVDVGVRYRGYIGDAAATYIMPDASDDAKKLAWETYTALHKGIANAVVGKTVAAISRAVQTHIESFGFSAVRELVGHGVGIYLHEEPQVPNFVDATIPDVKLIDGMTIAIEPMICAGKHRVFTDTNGWTVRTKDRKNSAHFEHTIAITEQGTRILSLLEDGSEPYVPPQPV